MRRVALLTDSLLEISELPLLVGGQDREQLLLRGDSRIVDLSVRRRHGLTVGDQ